MSELANHAPFVAGVLPASSLSGVFEVAVLALAHLRVAIVRATHRLAYNSAKRHRVVTLKGEVIENSGAMTGGGSTIRKGGMSSKLTGALHSSGLVSGPPSRGTCL